MGLGIPDEEFIRGQIPMTKENVRILSVAKLYLDKKAIVYDIGAGTGSVTVEMAHLCPEGKVYAIEQKEEGCELIKRNLERFRISNVEICHGIAPDCLESLEMPTHVFIGGSNGELLDIVKKIKEKNPKVRFVVTAVTLETIYDLMEIGKQYFEYCDMEFMQVSVTNCKIIGHHHMLQGENPIYIASFGQKR